MGNRHHLWWRGLAGATLVVGLWSATLSAHGVSGKDAVYLQGLQGAAIGPLAYLGAKHMVTATTISCSWSG